MKGFSGLTVTRYPGLFRGSLFLSLILLAHPAHSQLTHLDSVLAQSVGEMVMSGSGNQIVMSGDSTLAPLLAAAPRAIGLCLPVFYIDQLSATVRASKTEEAHMDIILHGALLRPSEPIAVPKMLTRTIDLKLTANDWKQLETNGTRYVHLEQLPPKSFWDSTLEPALVVLGAAVIVALFFLVRS